MGQGLEPRWLHSWLARASCSAGDAAAAIRQLSQLAPDDLGMLDSELRKLITYADGRTAYVNTPKAGLQVPLTVVSTTLGRMAS